jgi:transposase-like protein
LATKLFIEEVLKYCDGTPTFTVDSAPWLTGVLKELGLKYNVESFRR